MGHAVVAIKVEQNEYKPERVNQRTNPWFRNTMEDELVSIAIDNWTSSDSCDRNGSPSMSRAVVKPAMPIELAESAAYEMTNRDQNIIIPIISAKDYTIKKKTITVKFDDAGWKRYTNGHFGGWSVVEEAIVATNPELKGKITKIAMVRPEGSSERFNVRDGWTVRSTVEADTSGGKAKTKYYLVGDKLHEQRNNIKYFDTQAEARAWGVEVMNNDPLINNVSVKAKIQREDDTDLVKLTRKVSSATAKFEVSFYQMKTSTPKHDGWVVGFDYHV